SSIDKLDNKGEQQAMKICHYNGRQVGAVVGDRLHPLGDTLIKAGHLKPGYTMLDVVERLANDVAAMKCARFALQSVSSLPLASQRSGRPLRSSTRPRSGLPRRTTRPTRPKCAARWIRTTARASPRTS